MNRARPGDATTEILLTIAAIVWLGWSLDRYWRVYHSSPLRADIPPGWYWPVGVFCAWLAEAAVVAMILIGVGLLLVAMGLG